MEDDHDVLGKADALLKRHAPAPAGSGANADVPVLTEMITPGGDRPAVPDEEFIRKLVAEVASTVQVRLAQDLENRLTPQVIAEVRASIAATIGDLRQDIASAVSHAVAEALARRPHR